MQKKKSAVRKDLRSNWVLYLMALPCGLATLIFCYFPMAGIVMAFQNLDISKGIFRSPFVGLKNFEFLFATTDSWRITRNTITLNIIMGILAILTVLPLILVITISFSSAESIAYNGYSFFPSEWSLKAYTNLFRTGKALLNSYIVTIFISVVGPTLSLLSTSMYAFVLVHKQIKIHRFLSLFIFITTLFGGGLVPSYILNVRYLHLNDTIWIFRPT